MPTHICHYIKTDGCRCGSPALRDRKFCYFHYQANRPRATVRPLENHDAIQLALTDLARAVLAETIDLKRAGVLAYILQIASNNVSRVVIGLYRSDMVQELPAESEAIEELDAAYATLTPRANGSAGQPPRPEPAVDVMLNRHSLA